MVSVPNRTVPNGTAFFRSVQKGSVPFCTFFILAGRIMLSGESFFTIGFFVFVFIIFLSVPLVAADGFKGEIKVSYFLL